MDATPTATHALIAGAGGLSAAFAIMHPLDTLKTRIQASSRHLTSSLFRGFLPSVLGAAPQGGLRLATYTQCKALSDNPSLAAIVASACAGDLASSVVKVPREIITARMQTSRSTFVSTCTTIVASHGWRGMFVGFGTIAARDMPFMVILFTTYEHFRRMGDHPALMTLFGGTSGALAGFFTTPWDVVRTRLLTARPSTEPRSILTLTADKVASSGLKEKRQVALMSARASAPAFSTSAILLDIYRQQGMRGLFIGGLARSTWWFGVCAIFFPSYESILTLLQQ